jgi:hypothetical protein
MAETPSMKFFNLDLHVSVIEDVSTQFRRLGHTVDSHLMSGHFWALGKERAARGGGTSPAGKVGYGSINLETRKSLFDDFPKLERVKKWQDEHPELDEYDGFISTHPPAFFLLYERFRGHTIAVISIRYDFHFTERPEAWRGFNERLVSAVDSGRATVVANSKYDAAYYEHFTGQPAKYISSTCDYVSALAHAWCPRTKHVLAFGEHSGCREAAVKVPGVHFVRDILPQYRHDEIARAYGIVWIPYNCSIMSFFEHYWLGIPIFVPTPRFLLELYDQGLALSQITWHRSVTNGSNLPAVRGAAPEAPDPHTREGLEAWMKLYDFYNRCEFPHVTYFDSWNELRQEIEEVDCGEISQNMLNWNKVRLQVNKNKWGEVLARVDGDRGAHRASPLRP